MVRPTRVIENRHKVGIEEVSVHQRTLDRPIVGLRRGKDGPDASRVKNLNGSIDAVAFARKRTSITTS
jgi:hypothetical protein